MSDDVTRYATMFSDQVYHGMRECQQRLAYFWQGFKTAEGQKLAFELDEVKRRAFERIAKERADISCGESI